MAEDPSRKVRRLGAPRNVWTTALGSPAAKRRKNPAHAVRRGFGAEGRGAPKGRKKPPSHTTRTRIPVAISTSNQM